MRSTALLAAAGIVTAVCMTLSAADQEQNNLPKPQPIELSGRLHRPIKWTPQLELIPAGQIKRFDIQGKLLEGIEEGTYLHVRGVVRSRLHRGGTKTNPSPFPAQWTIWLEVTEVQVLNHPLDVLKDGNEE